MTTIISGSSPSITFSDSTTQTTAFTTPVSIANGGTGLTSFTANGVVYASSTSALATGSALVFDGTNVGVGGSPSAWGTTVSPAIQLSGSYGGSSISTYLGYQTFISANAYYNSGWKFISASASSGQYQINGNTHQWFNSTATPVSGNSTVYSQAMTLDASGNLMVGGTTPIYNAAGRGLITINGSSAAALGFTAGAVDKGIIAHTGTDMIMSNSGAGAIIFQTNNTERARIDSSGFACINTNAALASAYLNIKYDPASQYGIIIQNTSTTFNGSFIQFRNSAGTSAGQIISNGTATVAYQTSSDYRLKEDIEPMTNALIAVAKLKPVTYKWKADGSSGQGFIAHELQAVVPDCVGGTKDAVDAEGNPVYQGIDTSFLVATLTAAIQELNAKFDAYVASHP